MTRCPICDRAILLGGYRDGEGRYCSRYCGMRAAELENRELSEKERRLWIRSAGTRCWVCGATIYMGTGIADGDRQYCSRRCCRRAEVLRDRFIPAKSSPEIIQSASASHADSRARFASAVNQYAAAQRSSLKFFRIFPLVFLLSLPLLLWIVHGRSNSSVTTLVLIFAVVVGTTGITAAMKVDKLEKAHGLKCPHCNRYFRGQVLIHVRDTGKCMLCGGTVF
jgi:hypothetical protein